jgi:hypothetical protein
MNDERKLAELPTHSRMAWSSRSVWDRRTPVDRRPHRHPNMGVARGNRIGRSGNCRHRDHVAALARQESLVATTSVERRPNEFQ